jgi:hypothetical protein
MTQTNRAKMKKGKYWFTYKVLATDIEVRRNSERAIKEAAKELGLKNILIYRDSGCWVIENKLHLSIRYKPKY